MIKKNATRRIHLFLILCTLLFASAFCKVQAFSSSSDEKKTPYQRVLSTLTSMGVPISSGQWTVNDALDAIEGMNCSQVEQFINDCQAALKEKEPSDNEKEFLISLLEEAQERLRSIALFDELCEHFSIKKAYGDREEEALLETILEKVKGLNAKGVEALIEMISRSGEQFFESWVGHLVLAELHLSSRYLNLAEQNQRSFFQMQEAGTRADMPPLAPSDDRRVLEKVSSFLGVEAAGLSEDKLIEELKENIAKMSVKEMWDFFHYCSDNLGYQFLAPEEQELTRELVAHAIFQFASFYEAPYPLALQSFYQKVFYHLFPKADACGKEEMERRVIEEVSTLNRKRVNNLLNFCRSHEIVKSLAEDKKLFFNTLRQSLEKRSQDLSIFNRITNWFRKGQQSSKFCPEAPLSGLPPSVLVVQSVEQKVFYDLFPTADACDEEEMERRVIEKVSTLNRKGVNKLLNFCKSNAVIKSLVEDEMLFFNTLTQTLENRSQDLSIFNWFRKGQQSSKFCPEAPLSGLPPSVLVVQSFEQKVFYHLFPTADACGKEEMERRVIEKVRCANKSKLEELLAWCEVYAPLGALTNQTNIFAYNLRKIANDRLRSLPKFCWYLPCPWQKPSLPSPPPVDALATQSSHQKVFRYLFPKTPECPQRQIERRIAAKIKTLSLQEAKGLISFCESTIKQSYLNDSEEAFVREVRVQAENRFSNLKQRNRGKLGRKSLFEKMKKARSRKFYWGSRKKITTPARAKGTLFQRLSQALSPESTPIPRQARKDILRITFEGGDVEINQFLEVCSQEQKNPSLPSSEQEFLEELMRKANDRKARLTHRYWKRRVARGIRNNRASTRMRRGGLVVVAGALLLFGL